MEKIQRLKVDYSNNNTMLVWVDENTREVAKELGGYEVRYLSIKTKDPSLIININRCCCSLGYEDFICPSRNTIDIALDGEVISLEGFGEVRDFLIKGRITDINLFITNNSLYISCFLEDAFYFVKLFNKLEYPKLFSELKSKV